MKKVLTLFSITITLVFFVFSPILQTNIFAESSPWSQTNWVGGSGQTSWSDTTKYDSGSGITTSTASEVTLTKNEKLTNTGFESDVSSWTTTGTLNDSAFLGTSGAIAHWPLDDTTTTQSYTRVVNPAITPGRNIVLNDTFSADATWTKGTGWTIAGGVAHSDGTGASATLSQAIPITIGKSYSVSYTISNYVSGTVRVQLGSSGNGTNRTANGTYTETIAASGSTTLLLQNNTAFVGDIDNVSVTQLNILASTSFTQSELLTDSDMETSGTAAWTAANSATLSKQTTSPHGGSQVLRVARNGVNTPTARQAILTVGKTYRVQGYLRSDGNATPVVRENGTNIFTGTTSTSYQFFDVVRIAGSTQIHFGSTSTTGTEYVEFDDVSVTELDPLIGKPVNGATLGNSTGTNGHLTTAYLFDGVNDNANIYTSDLNGVFSPTEGTALAWAKVSSSAIWSDGTEHYVLVIRSDSSNKILIEKLANNRLIAQINNAGTASPAAGVVFTSTDWFQVGVTWSKTSDEVKFYINGVQQGSTSTGLGTWTGNLNSGSTAIGASDSSGNNPWSGMINDVKLYSRALTSSEILALYTGTVTTRDTSTTYSSSAGSAKIVAAADQQAFFTQSVNVGDTNQYNLVGYARTDGSAVTSSDLSLYANGSTVSTTYTSVGSGWYKLTGTVTGVASSVDYGVKVIAGKTVYLDNFSLSNYSSPGTLTSSIFDSGQGSNWGVLTYGASTPSNTTLTVKVRTSNDSSMSGATAFASCSAISSGSDISSNGCVTDTQRYVQYQVALTTSDILVTPTFTSFSLTFATSDDSAPTDLELRSPGDNSYTSEERPTFEWRTANDPSGIAKYQLVVTNDEGIVFSIDNIDPDSGEDYETNKYSVHYENFDDSDTENDYISVKTLDSEDWSESDNYGKITEGKNVWTVSAVDTLGNVQESSYNLYFDNSAPTLTLSRIGSENFNSSKTTWYTTSLKPTLTGYSSEAGTVLINFDKKGFNSLNPNTYNNYATATVHTDSSGNFTWTPEPLSYGNYRVTLQAKDSIGNSSQSITFNLVISQYHAPTSTPVATPIVTETPDESTSETPSQTLTPIETPSPVVEEPTQAGPNIVEKIGTGVISAIQFFIGGVGDAISGSSHIVGNIFGNIASGISNVYNAIANGAPTAIKNTMLALGNSIKGISQSISLIASNIGRGINNGALSAQRGIANATFGIGTRMQDFSYGIGTGIIKVGYLFVPEPTTIFNVQVVVLSPTSAKISWKTNHPANGKVNYGLDETYPFDVQTEKRTTDHEFVLTDLKPNTEYSFEVMSQNRNYVYDANRRFMTTEE